jgi:hypothetical protein
VAVRAIKKKVLEILRLADYDLMQVEIDRIAPKKVVSPLFSFFNHREELVRWRSVSAMGRVVAGMADRHLEDSRVVMRRLMWSLNDESGGIGWGAPEAMGDIMARHEQLAQEFHRILISYIRPDGNFIEYALLQRGVLWGVGRLAQIRPILMGDAHELLLPYTDVDDATCRGTAVWAMRQIKPHPDETVSGKLSADNQRFRLYLDGELYDRTVADVVAPAGG